MEFKTYVKSSPEYSIEEIKKHLLEKVGVEEQNHHLREALTNSGGSHLASRYGLDKTITFADSELISAYERGDECVDYLQYRYDFKYYPGNHKLREFPLVVAVEASSKCNLRCKMCFQKHMDSCENPQNQGIMSWELYQKFLDELEENILYSIVFASRGEPLLNPNIDRMIREAKARGVQDIKLNTNATLLTADMSRRLLNSGLDLLVFSVDSVDPDNYRAIRGVSLEKVLTNIDTFLKIRATEFPDSKLKVRVAMVMTEQMKHLEETEVRRAQEYWLNRVDEFSVKTENDFISVYDDCERDMERNVCSLLWERMYLWHDGSVNPCDIDHLSSLCVGSIEDGDSIADIWKGKKMEQLRESHMTARCKMSGVCANCTGY